MPEPTVYIPASEVIERILERKKGGLPLSKVGQHDPVLARSASKHFGGWRNHPIAVSTFFGSMQSVYRIAWMTAL